MSTMGARTEGRASRGAARSCRTTALAALASLGAANMAVVALKQLGVIRHLPDPPLGGFYADRVTSRPEARLFGLPDAPLEAMSLAVTALLARWSGRAGDRRPWLPLLVAGKAGAEAGIAAWYVERMRSHVHAWCAYCLTGAVLNAGTLMVAMPDGADGLRRSSQGLVLAVGGTVALGWLAWRLGHGRSMVPRGRRSPPGAAAGPWTTVPPEMAHAA